MIRSKSIYLKELDNVLRMVQCTEKEYNIFIYRILGVNSKFLLSFLSFITPVIYTLNIITSSVYFVFSFFSSIIYTSFKKKKSLHNINELFLFFTPLFYERIKSARLFDKSKFWVIGPNVNKKIYDLRGKEIIHYKDLLSISDYAKNLKLSFSTLVQYVYNYRCIYFVHKAWKMYEVQLALEKITTKSTIYFANQSDRWALLFDSLPSKMKVLVQHGLAPHEFEVPHKLNHVDVFYSISKSTWKDAYKNILTCKPEIKMMQPTISLTEVISNKFKILIISLILNFELEKELIEFLQDKQVDIYVKKHPRLLNDSCYRELNLKNKFTYIQEDIFPKVDFVVSYYSTLAYEYMNFDIPVYQYDSKNDFNILFIEREINNIKLASHNVSNI